MTREAFFHFRQAAPLDTFRDLDHVMLTADVAIDDGATMPAGSEGIVLSVYRDGVAYVVEFAEPVGSLATVQGASLRLVERAAA
ncbi:hypothetical protein ASG52_00510 [Methylobacterium sp. Leaf456]|uniref:hypothetical protein n=1 Tax=Methylobacterium sp. Leaf456 TaxID=1736382 RepID=UPI00070219D6|nr:hypothetical protein [Methylobacterium sp. Leaf456]KQT61407.1 hypothetical protein ASG52_00510 [Methylobacterium sp. Leaf456]